MGRADTYSQPDAPDMVLPEGLVLGLARAHMPPPDLISSVLAVDESGGEARAYLLDGGAVVKPSDRTGCDHGPAWRRRPRCSPPPSQRCRGGSRRCSATPRWTPGPARSSSTSRGRRGAAVVHARDTNGLLTAGLLPVDGDAARLRRRVELGLADLVEHFDAHPDSWPLTVPPAQVAVAALDALPSRVGEASKVQHGGGGGSAASGANGCSSGRRYSTGCVCQRLAARPTPVGRQVGKTRS